MNENTFNVYVMSFRRPDTIETKKHLAYCTYVVREEEAEAYRKAGIEKMLVIPKDARLKDGISYICSFMTTFWWIIENTPESCIAILDDDIFRFAYRLDEYVPIDERHYPNPQEVVSEEIERLAQLLVDLNLGMLTDNPQYAMYSYTSEFTFKGMCGALRIINKPCFKCKYDWYDPAWSDIDMIYQELLRNRIILQPRYFMAMAHKDTNVGGQYSDSEIKHNFHIAMKNKWMKYYSYDEKKNITKIKVQR